MSTLLELGERNLIDRIRHRIRSTEKNILGTIDDAAVYDTGKTGEYLVITTDRIAFPYGLKKGIGTYKDFGKYFACSVINDVIAKGAEPFAFLQAIGLPPDMKITELDQFVEGVCEILDCYNVEIIGGDTKEKKNSEIDVVGTCIGWTVENKVISRSGAKVGDVIAVTDKLGLFSAYMFSVCKKNYNSISCSIREAVRKEYISNLDISYRVMKIIRSLNSCNASADISDGLLGDISRIANCSEVGAIIYIDKIPVSKILEKMSKLLSVHPSYFPCCVGGDLQIVLTIEKNKWDETYKKLKQENLTLYPIGEVIKEQRLYLANSVNKMIEEPIDWENFRNQEYEKIFLKVSEQIFS